MSDQHEEPSTPEEEADSKLDRRRVLREFARTGKYAAPIATVLLFGAKDVAAMVPSDLDV